MKREKGFTLIELLVVIGILSILAVALLIAINPAEAQRKARDTQRLKDLTNVQAAVEGWINDNVGSSLSMTVSSGPLTATTRNCNNGWLTAGGSFNMCNYMNRLPVDPRNTNTQVSNSSASEISASAFYYVKAIGGVYHICTYLESKSNSQKLRDDGIVDNVFSVYSSTSATGLSTCP